MSLTSSIDSLTNAASTQPYTASASLGADGAIDKATSAVTGDRNSGLFKAKQGLQKDDFLQLLVKQLQYQDPMSPMDNKDLLAQLAQFSSIESSNNIEKSITTLNDSFQGSVTAQRYSAESISNASAIGLIGNQVLLRQTTVGWYGKSGETTPIRVHLGSSPEAEVQILDSDGTVVKTLTTTGKDGRNSSTVEWDGTKDDGLPAKAGTYEVRITGEETNPDLYAFIEDVVGGVRFSATGPMLKVAGTEMAVGDLMDVSPASTSGSSSVISFNTAISLIGDTVRLREKNFNFGAKSGEQKTVQINMSGSTSATVQILDSKGNVVDTLTATAANGEESVPVTWSGRINNGQEFAPAGQYTIRIVGENLNPNLYAFSEGRVDGVSTAVSGGIQLRIGGALVSPTEILDVSA